MTEKELAFRNILSILRNYDKYTLDTSAAINDSIAIVAKELEFSQEQLQGLWNQPSE